jgi:hypothetical protein
MKNKIKYKCGRMFGAQPEGAIIDAYILNIDEASGIALCYHPPARDECGSFEFIKRKQILPKKEWEKYKDCGLWISAFGEECYSNKDKMNKKFKKFLKDELCES